MNSLSLTALSIAGVSGIPIFIGWYIWRGQFTAPLAWAVALCWIVASFLIHRDAPKTLRMRPFSKRRETVVNVALLFSTDLKTDSGSYA